MNPKGVPGFVRQLATVGSMAFAQSLIACGPVDALETSKEFETSEETASVTEELNGELTFGDGCTRTMRENIHAAMDIAVQKVHGRDLLECLRDAPLVMTDDDMPERIVARLRENMPTRVGCNDDQCAKGAWGCAPVDRPRESLWIPKDPAENLPPSTLAGVIVHEVAHNKGYRHPYAGKPDYDYTVPVQVGMCVWQDAPYGLPRSQAYGESELAPVGGGGGNPFELSCTDSRFVRGFAGDSSSLRLDRLSLQCDEHWQDEAVGVAHGSTRSGQYTCPDGEVVTGIWGQGDQYVNHLGFFCTRESDVRARASDPPEGFRWVGGKVSGTPFTRKCPPGMAVKRVYGRSGARIDQMRVICQDMAVHPRGEARALPVMGKPRGNSRRHQCMGFGLMTKLFGRAGAGINELGGTCTETTLDADELPLTTTDPFYEHPIEGTNRKPDSVGPLYEWEDACPPLQGLIGFHGYENGDVRALRGICADPRQWTGSAGTAYTSSTPWRGSRTGTFASRRCPRGQFLVGLETWEDQAESSLPRVQAVRPICRWLGGGVRAIDAILTVNPTRFPVRP